MNDTIESVCRGLCWNAALYNSSISPTVTSIGERDILGFKRKEIFLKLKERSDDFQNDVSWVDGIGIFPNDPFSNYNNIGWGWYETLLLCMKGEEVLYSCDEYGYNNGIEVLQALGYPLSVNAVMTTAPSDDALYDLQGRRVRGAPSGGGVYIDKGRKVLYP